MGITEKDLERCYAELGSRFGGHKNDYFALLYLAQEFKGNPIDYGEQVAFGGSDYGMDAFHIDRETRNFYLYQFKWSTSHTLFKDSLKRIVDSGFAMVFGDPKQDKQANQFIMQMKNALDENQAIIDRVYVRFVFNGNPEAADGSRVLDALREDLESKRFLLDQFFGGRAVALTIDFVSNETKKRSQPTKQKRSHTYRFELDRTIDVATSDGCRLHVGFVPLMALHGMYVEMGPRLFDRNIRMGLDGEKPTNRAIKSSLRAIADGVGGADLFALDHNGVTLSVQRFEHADGRASVTEPRVLNGAQTITTVGRFLEDRAGNKLGEEGMKQLEHIRVLARIIEASTAEMVTRVTINNNRQNPVEPWHLRASDAIQLELEDRFKDELGVFYERQEKAFEALSDSDLDEMGIEQQGQAVEIKKLAQTFLAVQGEIDRMSRLTEVFDIQKQYDDCFKRTYLKADLRKLVLCYKVQRRLRRLIEEIKQRGGNKYAFVDRGRNLVWALMCQAILNEDAVDDWAEKWGGNLYLDAEFSERMKGLASAKVRIILSALLEDEDVAEQIEAERYTFLRTKVTFARCMEIAAKRHRWEKRSF